MTGTHIERPGKRAGCTHVCDTCRERWLWMVLPYDHECEHICEGCKNRRAGGPDMDTHAREHG